jgi:hypothetical protein
MAVDEQALPFVFRVLEGVLAGEVLQAGQPPGQIVLADRALPQGDVTIEGDQREKTTWYPGNPEASQQVIGPVELPSTMSGVWKDRYLGNGQAVALMRAFDDVRRRGPLMEVSWGAGILSSQGVDQVGDPFTRRGILKKAKFSFPYPQWCRWELTFSWRGLGDLTAAPVMATGVVNPREGLADTAGALDDLADAVAAFRGFAHTRLVGLPAQVFSRMQDYMDAANDASDAIKGASAAATRLGTFQGAAPVLGALRNGVDAANSMRLLVEALDPSRLAASDGAMEILNIRSNMLLLLGHCDRSRDACLQAVETLSRTAAPDVIGEVRPPAGTDLREIARAFYGDPDGWTEIAEYNDLPTSEVPMPASGPSDQSGEPIQVPRRGLAGGLAGGC